MERKETEKGKERKIDNCIKFNFRVDSDKSFRSR